MSKFGSIAALKVPLTQSEFRLVSFLTKQAVDLPQAELNLLQISLKRVTAFHQTPPLFA